MPKTHLRPVLFNARLLNEFFRFVLLVELREARDSAYPVPTFNAENALKVRPRSCSSLKRLTPLCYYSRAPQSSFFRISKTSLQCLDHIKGWSPICSEANRFAPLCYLLDQLSGRYECSG